MQFLCCSFNTISRLVERFLSLLIVCINICLLMPVVIRPENNVDKQAFFEFMKYCLHFWYFDRSPYFDINTSTLEECKIVLVKLLWSSKFSIRFLSLIFQIFITSFYMSHFMYFIWKWVTGTTICKDSFVWSITEAMMVHFALCQQCFDRIVTLFRIWRKNICHN